MAGTYTLLLEASDSRFTVRDTVTVTVHPANKAPVVDAGADQGVELPAKAVSLAGSVTDDGLPPPSAVQATWTVVSGPGPVSFADPASAVTTATLSAAGTYVLRLTATDGSLSSSDDVTVLLETENEPPVVSAGPDVRAFSLLAALAGSVSDDGKPRGKTLSSSWSVVSGPGAVSFASPASPATTVTFAVPGTYVLRLSATDGALSAADDVLVTANPANEPPFVDAGPAQSVTSRRTVLRGTVRDDGLPAESAVTVLWSQLSGPAPSGLASPAAAETAVVFDAEGSYVFRLLASDGERTAEDTVGVEVRFVNTAPSVEAGADATIALPANAVVLRGSVTDDALPLGSTLTPSWALSSGPAAVVFEPPGAVETTARFTDPGTYVLRLRASDGALSAEDRVTVVVQPRAPTGTAPVALLKSPSTGTRLSVPVDVAGTATSDSLASWQLERRLQGDSEWVRFASGTSPVADGPLGTLDPTLLLNGIYEVRLTVTDTASRIARSAWVVVVREQVKVGHFSVSFVDMEVPVAGLPLRVTRTYDSRDKRRGEFGAGWRLELANVRVQPAATLGLSWYGTASASAFATYCLQPTAPPLVTLTFPDGRVQEFEVRLTPECQTFQPMESARVSFVPVGPTLGRLELLGSSDVLLAGSWPGPMQLFGEGYKLFDPAAYRYTAPDGQVFVVSRTAGLQSLTDRAGNVLTMSPAGITSTHPLVPGSTLGLAFTRDAQGRITHVTDPDGRSLVYAYDTAGDLVSVTDREGAVTAFTYEEELPHQLRDILDPLGRRPIRNEYFEDGRLKSHTDAFGNTIEYQHDVLGRQEVVRDRTGAQRVLEYDERGNVVRETDPQGRVVVRTFDGRNNRLTESEPYDPANPPDPIPTATYTYDPSENVLSTKDALGNISAYTYNSTRQVLTTTDARGAVTTNAYDGKGNRLSTTEQAATKASRAGYAAVGLFIDSRALRAGQVLQEIPRKVGGVLREGVIAVIKIETKDGWIRILP